MVRELRKSAARNPSMAGWDVYLLGGAGELDPCPVLRLIHSSKLRIFLGAWRGVRMAKEPVLKTGARKRMWVRVPPPPFP